MNSRVIHSRIRGLFLRIILIYHKLFLGLLFAACLVPSLAGQADDSLSASRRVVAAAALAAKEYAAGVPAAGGRINRPEEVDEAKQFIDQARFDVPLLPTAVRAFGDSALAASAADCGFIYDYAAGAGTGRIWGTGTDKRTKFPE